MLIWRKRWIVSVIARSFASWLSSPSQGSYRRQRSTDVRYTGCRACQTLAVLTSRGLLSGTRRRRPVSGPEEIIRRVSNSRSAIRDSLINLEQPVSGYKRAPVRHQSLILAIIENQIAPIIGERLGDSDQRVK